MSDINDLDLDRINKIKKQEDRKRLARNKKSSEYYYHKKEVHQRTRKALFASLGVGGSVILASAISIPLICIAHKKSDDSKTRFTITFDTDGGTSVSSESVVINEYAIEPKAPTKSGYEFVEWHTEDNVLFQFNKQKITKNIKLKAIWRKVETVTYIVTFKCGTNGKFISGESTFETSTVTVTKGSYFSAFTKPNVKPNDNYICNGWLKDGKLITNESFPIESDMEFTASYALDTTKVDINLSSSVLDTTSKVRGQNIISVDKNSTFASIKESLPVAELSIAQPSGQTIEAKFEHWSLTKQTSRDTIPEQCPDSEPLTSGKILYPAFSFKVEDITQMVTLNMKLTSGQVVAGDVTKIEVPYKASSIKKFSEVIKPQVTEDVLVFDGYYHNYDSSTQTYSNPWTNDEEILPTMSNTDIYVKFKAADDDVIITFDKSDVTVEGETKPVTYVGSTSVKCPLNTMLSTIAPSCYWDAQPDPDARVKYYSTCYFDHWSYMDGSTEVTIDPSVDFKIEQAITLKPHFLKKPILTFYLNEDETPGEESIQTIDYTPSASTKWSDLTNLPTAEDKVVVGENWFFAGWKATLTDGSTIVVTPETNLSEIDNTKPIVPSYTNQCHKLTFSETGLIDGVEKTCVLVGNKTIGVQFTTETLGGLVQTEINKPVFPTSPLTPGASESTYNKNMIFNNQWQIKGGAFTNWTDVDNETRIQATGPQIEYELRPVATSKFTIYYKTDSTKGKFVNTDPAPTSETEDTATVGDDQVFKTAFQPTIQAQDGWEFTGWNDSESGTGTSYEPDSKIVRPESGKTLTLYAQYKSSNLSTCVNYHIFEDELNDPDYPADSISTDNNFSSYVSSPKGTTSVKYKEFVKISANRKYYDFIGWGYEDENGKYTRGDKKYSLITDETEITTQKHLDLYAIFEMGSDKYTKFTIADQAKTKIEGQPEKYTIVGDHKFFGKITGDMPFNATTKQVQDSDIFVYAVGYEIDYWVDSDGNKLEGKIQDKEYLDIVPIFKTSTRKISFELKPDDITAGAKFTATGTSTYSTTTQLPYYDNLISYIDGEKADKLVLPLITASGLTINGWQIKKVEGTTTTYEDIKSDTLIDADITLVPKLIGESIFKNGDRPYYYDEADQQWYQIYNYSTGTTDQMQVRKYINSEYVYKTVTKSTFNYEVKLGTLMEKIPDDFMNGCVLWNNGGKSFTIPSIITEIGNNFMFGCASFNQNIIIENDALSGGADTSLKIGANFMRKCYSFNSNINLNLNSSKSNGSIYISKGFMQDTAAFTKALDLSGWTNWYYLDETGVATKFDPASATKTDFAKNFYTCLTTTSPYRGQFTVYVNSDQIENFKTMFPNLDNTTIPGYRDINVTSK